MNAAVLEGIDRGIDAPLRPGAVRWIGCFVLILALHAAVVWVVLHWPTVQEAEADRPPPAVMLELSPLPAAPVVPPSGSAPAAEHAVSQPAPPPQPKPVHLLPTLPLSRVAAPLPPAALRETPPQRTVSRDASKQPDAPQPAKATTALSEVSARAEAGAPAPGAAPAPATEAAPNWQGMLLSRLERFKRYPREAQWRRQEGVPYVRFSMDRHGKVLSLALERSSGIDALDAEALALVHRAEPLPPPPAEVPGDPLELVVPVEFFMK